MFTRKVFASILIPSAAVIAEAKQQEQEEKEQVKCRPSELPLYTPDKNRPILIQEIQQNDVQPNVIEKSVGTIRVKLVSAIDQVKYYKDVTGDYIVDGFSGAQWMVDYLGQDSADPTHKAGAIAVGGLAGFIMGLRGGFIRRTLFTSIGALGMASICYPKEAAEYSAIAAEKSRNYATIGYNFIYGVKADDPPLELPKMPASFTELWDLISGSNKEKSVSEPELKQTEQVIQVENEKISTAPTPASESILIPTNENNFLPTDDPTTDASSADRICIDNPEPETPNETQNNFISE